MIRYYWLFIFFLFSCEDKVDWQLNQGEKRISVDAVVTNESVNQLIKIFYVFQQSDRIPEPVSGAVVQVFDGVNVFIFQEDSNRLGHYYSQEPFGAVLGNTYKLEVVKEGKSYEASADIVPVTPLREVKYQYVASANLFQITGLSDAYTEDPFMEEVVLKWNHLPERDTLGLGKDSVRFLTFAFNTIDVAQVFSPEKEKIFFPYGTVLLQTKYSLTPEHAAFLKAVVAETNWRGGVFDVEATEIPTNISNGAVGYFGVCTVIRRKKLITA